MEEERGLRTNEPKKAERTCKSATLLSKIVFVLCFLAFILHMIGFYCPYWSQREFIPPKGLKTVETRGLWQKCRFTHMFSKCYGIDSYGRMFFSLLFFLSSGRMRDYKYLSCVYGVDRKICHEGH